LVYWGSQQFLNSLRPTSDRKAGKKANLQHYAIHQTSIRSQENDALLQTMIVKCLATDHDGTINPIHVTRSQANISPETGRILGKIGKSIPIAIITTKDLRFVKTKTLFAHAWSTVGGLETQVDHRILKRDSLASRMPKISRAINFARSHITAVGIEIEPKQDSEGRTIAFCVDWRQTSNPSLAKKQAHQIADYSEALGLQVIMHRNQPFIDVYPFIPDKGRALKEILTELAVDDGVLYMGDSEIDNSAFQNSNISIGVIHSETRPDNLESDFFVNFEDMPSFLENLVKSSFRFSPSFPCLKLNPIRKRKASKLLVKNIPSSRFLPRKPFPISHK
jgi:trehalose-phosphatase